MPNVSKGDAVMLAATFTSLAEDVAAYQADHGADPDVDQMQLATLVSSLTQHSQTILTDALATVFGDAAKAAEELQSATASARDKLAHLQTLEKQYERVAAIASSCINVAVGLATRNPGAALSAAASLNALVSDPS